MIIQRLEAESRNVAAETSDKSTTISLHYYGASYLTTNSNPYPSYLAATMYPSPSVTHLWSSSYEYSILAPTIPTPSLFVTRIPNYNFDDSADLPYKHHQSTPSKNNYAKDSIFISSDQLGHTPNACPELP